MSDTAQARGVPPLRVLLTESVAQVRAREATAMESLLAAHERRVVVFGCGGLGRRTVEKLRKLGAPPLALCDNNSSLWGTEIDGIPVVSVADAAARFGREALFMVAVWNPHHWYAETADQLRAAGARSICSYQPLYWRFPDDYLQVYLLNGLPSRLYEAKGEVLAAETLWGDEESLHIYRANICWRALGDPEGMPHRPAESTYFPPKLFSCRAAETIIDCGAFDGDTIKQVLGKCGEELRAIFSLEGDAVSFSKLQSFVAILPEVIQERVHLIHGAVGGERCKVRFTSDGGTGSHMGTDEGVEVECYPLDSLDVPEPVTMIKMDIEGAEYDALLGARRILERDKPVLAICVYHTQADIWRIPLLVRELLPQHLLYLRAYEGDGFQTVMYAVPPDRAL